MSRKLALIIGNGHYEDACLSKLRAPDVDVRGLAEVLTAPGIGAFDEVTPILNEGLAMVRKAIARFFDAKHRDDLLFLYFSGHGVRDEQGHLYLAVRDTERAVLAGTAIEASFVTARMDRSASKRLVLVLDCCHSGAFGYGAKAAQGASVGTATAFEGTGRGRVVLTATDSTQYAWEGDQVIGDVENSLFTHYLIEGLRSGAADRDEDGLITIDEIYDYVYDRVLSETPKQTPGKWAFGQQGEIIIARNPSVSAPKLPPEVEEALKSALPSVRLQSLPELNAIIKSRHEGRARAAREALQRLAEDDSRKVATSALVLLQALERGELLADDEWQRRVRDKEEELNGGRSVAAQIAAYVATGQASLERGALEDAREMLARASALNAEDAGVLQLQTLIELAAEERTRLEEAERQIRELRKNIAALIARANAAGPHDEAISLLNEALGLDPEHTEVKQLLEARHRLKAEAEAAERARLEREADHAARQQAELDRRAQIEAQLSEASRHLARENLTKAVVITEAVLKADPEHPAARALNSKARRAVEARKDADERVAEERERQRQIEDMIATAEVAPTHDTALEILNAVLVRDPGNARAQRLLDRRLAERDAAIGAPKFETPIGPAVPVGVGIADLSQVADDHEAYANGFSLRPTFSAAVKWFRTQALRSTTFKTAAGLVLAIVIAQQYFHFGSSAPDTKASSPSATQAAPPDTHKAEAEAAGPVSAPGRGAAATSGPPPMAAKKEEGSARSGRSGSPSLTGGAAPTTTETRPATEKPAAKPPVSAGPAAPVAPPAPTPAPKTSAPDPTTAGGSKASAAQANEPAGTTAGTRPAEERNAPARGGPSPKPEPDDDSLRSAVKAYESAFSSANRDAVRAVYPTVSDKELREVERLKLDFGRDRYRMNIVIDRTRINGTRADVVCTIFHSGVDDRGKPQFFTDRKTLRFEWDGRTWVRTK
jgi:tetratricopeptide (TPR) repeat protein